MGRILLVRLSWFLVMLVLAVPPRVAAQEAPQAAEPSPAQTREEQADPAALQVPVSVDRIKEGLAFQRALKLPVDLPPLEVEPSASQRPLFRAEVWGEAPTLQSLLDRMDLRHGPVPFSSPTHSEFLAMVTPQELHSSAGFNAMELLTAGLSAKAIEWMVAQAMAAARERSEREEKERIQRQIDRELREIEERRNPPNR